MKLRYTEHRTTVNRDTVEVSDDFTDDKGYQSAVLKEIGTCLEYDSTAAAHVLVDWCAEVSTGTGPKVGQKVQHQFGTGLDPVGTWEIIS